MVKIFESNYNTDALRAHIKIFLKDFQKNPYQKLCILFPNLRIIRIHSDIKNRRRIQ